MTERDAEYLTFGEKWTIRGSGLVPGVDEGIRWIPDVAVDCPDDPGSNPHFLAPYGFAYGEGDILGTGALGRRWFVPCDSPTSAIGIPHPAPAELVVPLLPLMVLQFVLGGGGSL